MFKVWWKCINYLIIYHLYFTSGEYKCHTIGKNISCTALEENSLYENLTIILSKEESYETKELKIENSAIPVLRRKMFVNFKNIEILHLRNTSTREVEEEAFQDLYNVKEVYVTNNYLEEFNSNTFSINNSVRVLDLSRNLIHNLDSFDMEMFPLISIMNISHNRLEYLPQSILNKVTEENKFYLIVDNNPWNCSHKKWGLKMTEILIQALCTNKTYNPTEMESKLGIMENLKHNDTNEKESGWEITCLKYSFKNCLLWAFGAVWIGIIIGNVCKLKKLLFTPPRRYEDKNIQCEYSWKEPFLREDHTNRTPSKPTISK